MVDIAMGRTSAVPVTEPMKQVAERVARARRHWGASSQDERHIYFNVLAVLVMESYCRAQQVETDLNASEIWQFGSKTRPADLPIVGWGRVECCAVRDDTVDLSGRRALDRVGYAAVWFSEAGDIARPAGFLDTVSTTTVLLNRWHPIEAFLARLPRSLPSEAIALLPWRNQLFQSGWQTIDSLPDPPWELTYKFRSHLCHSAIEAVKVLHFENHEESVVMLVGFDTARDRDIDIWTRIYPQQDDRRLPYHLSLQLLDRDRICIMKAQARSTRSVQLEFSGEPGEVFGLKVELNDCSVTETFTL
ncbi:hypothetical protein AY599_02395 [Leptolyngbya valderiana BDU 20041]|nr:hypothetical protein AY599_02395 [Leptolyngbya valderiana BDU 20041]